MTIMARLYANENFPFPVVEELRRLGHNVLTTVDAGNAGKALPDEAVLATAVAERRILITLNGKHFSDCTSSTASISASLSVRSILISQIKHIAFMRSWSARNHRRAN